MQVVKPSLYGRLVKRIRLFRLLNDLTQIDLSRQSGVPASQISLIERGHLLPSPRDLESLSQALDVPAEEMVGDVEGRVNLSGKPLGDWKGS